MRSRGSLLVLGATLVACAWPAYAQSPRAGSPAPSAVPAAPNADEPRPISTKVAWNLPPEGLDWKKAAGKVVMVDFWNTK